MKMFATKTPRHQGFFNNKPLGVSLCLRAFVAIFIAGGITPPFLGRTTFLCPNSPIFYR
jgi:hypothetical protein